MADLCQRRAFHLDRERIGKTLAQRRAFGRARHESVAADDQAGADLGRGDGEGAQGRAVEAEGVVCEGGSPRLASASTLRAAPASAADRFASAAKRSVP